MLIVLSKEIQAQLVVEEFLGTLVLLFLVASPKTVVSTMLFNLNLLVLCWPLR